MLVARVVDLLALIVVLAVAAWIRLEFARIGVPALVTTDSDDYLWPGYALAHGLGFDLELRRTPLYPLFVALVLKVGGNLATLTVAQHVLGIITAGLTFGLGRVTFGPLAGLLAGLAIAVSGPMLIYEHYVMSEALFTLFLTLALLTLTLALRRGTRLLLLTAGATVALAVLTRPIGQALIPIAVGSAFLLALPRWRVGASRALLVAAGLLLVLSPWLARNWLAHGTAGSESALGEALIARTIRHDRGFVYDDPARPDPDPVRAAARRIIQEEANGEASGGTISAHIRDELGLTQARTNALLRDLAIDVIRQRPAHYAATTGDMAWQLFRGVNERLRGNWRERTTRNWDNQWDPHLATLLDPETPAEGAAYERADALTSAFQPWRWRGALTWLFGIGALAALLLPRFRLGLLPALAVVALVVLAAALDGLVWRYRYPVDPALFVVAAGGIAAPLWIARALIARRSARSLPHGAAARHSSSTEPSPAPGP